MPNPPKLPIATVEPVIDNYFGNLVAEAATASDQPILLRIEYDAGHGVGSTKTQVYKERADIFAFMMWQFGMPDYQLQ